MGFLGVYRAIYDYTPQAGAELAIKQGDLLYIIEKNGDDGWWRAKKKVGADDEDEPTGLVPNNYVQEAEPVTHARAVYEYTRQTDEELSFPEDAVLQVFDTSDPDWILVGLDDEYGFVPSNYIEMQDGAPPGDSPPPAAPPTLPARPQPPAVAAEPDDSPERPTPTETPASAIASVVQARVASRSTRPPPQLAREPVPREESLPSDDESIRSPTLPSRPRPQFQLPYQHSPDRSSERGRDRIEEPSNAESHPNPGGFHLYNINEMVYVMGKRKKMPTTLGINLGTGTILIAPERAHDNPPQEWTADKMTHYSREGKHVFMELVRPSKSIDFHAGAKDTAEEIVASLGELAGAVRAEGLREVIMAGSQRRQKKGTVLYDFMAQGEDEVTVAAGDDVIIIDDGRSEEWWQVRRLKNGKEGVVPSSYIELTGTVTPPLGQIPSPPTKATQISAKATIEQNRLEEIRLTKEAMKASKEPQQVGPGMLLPERGSSLMARENGNNLGQQRTRRENGRNDGGSHSKPKAKPDASKVRTWTDRSKSFSVDAQFLGLKDGKLHLHKLNGVKIAVPIAKMSRDDLEYVESVTGISLDDERPLADVKRKSTTDPKSSAVGATIEPSPGRPEYDWFQFFLSCDVAVGLCERYAQAFTRDSMDESVLPDVDASILRNLGLREGDIIKVMRALDIKYRSDKAGGEGDGSGGLFSGPRGALRNNTRKGRPAPAVQTSDVVDAAAFSTKEGSSSGNDGAKSPSAASPAKSPRPPAGGFDDDAWDVKPTKQEQQQQASGEPKAAAPAEPASNPRSVSPALTGSMKELSLLTAPLQPSKSELATQAQPQAFTSQVGEEKAPSQQLPGASPSFFSTVPQLNQATGVQASQGSLVPPPPQRPLSAPQSIVNQGLFPPPMLAPQMTGSLQGQVAPPGQSLNDLNQVRLQQQYTSQLPHMQPVLTGYPGTLPQGLAPFPTGAPGQFMQPMMTGAPGLSPFADPRASQFSLSSQPTGFNPAFSQSGFGQPAPGTINSYLSTPLEPQRTGLPTIQQPPQTSATGGFNTTMQAQPLVPQQTGPPPPVRFGVTDAKKLTPQPTGRRANLAQATPQNPFGF